MSVPVKKNKAKIKHTDQSTSLRCAVGEINCNMLNHHNVVSVTIFFHMYLILLFIISIAYGFILLYPERKSKTIHSAHNFTLLYPAEIAEMFLSSNYHCKFMCIDEMAV